MTSTTPQTDKLVHQSKGDNVENKGGTKDAVISRELRAKGACGGHVTLDPRELSHHNLQLNHFSSNFPSFTLRSADSQSNPEQTNLSSAQSDHNRKECVCPALTVTGQIFPASETVLPGSGKTEDDSSSEISSDGIKGGLTDIVYNYPGCMLSSAEENNELLSYLSGTDQSTHLTSGDSKATFGQSEHSETNADATSSLLAAEKSGTLQPNEIKSGATSSVLSTVKTGTVTQSEIKSGSNSSVLATVKPGPLTPSDIKPGSSSSVLTTVKPGPLTPSDIKTGSSSSVLADIKPGSPTSSKIKASIYQEEPTDGQSTLVRATDRCLGLPTSTVLGVSNRDKSDRLRPTEVKPDPSSLENNETKTGLGSQCSQQETLPRSTAESKTGLSAPELGQSSFCLGVDRETLRAALNQCFANRAWCPENHTGADRKASASSKEAGLSVKNANSFEKQNPKLGFNYPNTHGESDKDPYEIQLNPVSVESDRFSAERQLQTEGDNSRLRLHSGNAKPHCPVTIGTHAPSLSHFHESFCCGGTVNVLPPIVERAESDVKPFPPIAEGEESDVTAAMLSDRLEAQKLPLRGKTLRVEPFFVRKKSHECGTTKNSNSSNNNNNNSNRPNKPDAQNDEDILFTNDANIAKLRSPVGKPQLPTFVLRRTSSSPSASDAELSPLGLNMSTTPGRSGTSRKLGVSHEKTQAGLGRGNDLKTREENPGIPVSNQNDHTESALRDTDNRSMTSQDLSSTTISKPERAKEVSNARGPCSDQTVSGEHGDGSAAPVFNTSQPPDSPSLRPNQQTTLRTVCPEGNIVQPSPEHLPRGKQAMYNVSMVDDSIRVDINPQVSTHAEDQSTAKRSTNIPNVRMLGDIGKPCLPSASDDDEFPDDGCKKFHEWSEMREGRSMSLNKESQFVLDLAALKKAQAVEDEVKSWVERRVAFKGSQEATAAGDGRRSHHRSLDDVMGDYTKQTKRKTSWRPPPLLPSNSEMSLSPARRTSLAVSLDSEKVRRNSVTILRPKTRHVSMSNTSSRSQSPSDRVATAPKRRASTKSMLGKLIPPATVQVTSTVPEVASALEFLTWTHLLSTYPAGEVHSTSIQRSEIMVSIPVCRVTKGGSTISVTSVQAIEQTLFNVHPTLQVLLANPQSNDDKVPGGPAPPPPPPPPPPPQHTLSVCVPDSQAPASVSTSAVTSLPEAVKGVKDTYDGSTDLNKRKYPVDSNQRTYLQSENERRISINTCIRTMREGSGNYDSQLIGCENLGSYADEETLKVVLAKSDAISCVINAMKAFLEKEELQRQACASLLKMASISEANCAYISGNDGVTAITNTMRRYENNLDIAVMALSILGYLSTTDNLTTELLSYGCHSDVLAAMSRHSDDRTIVMQSCFILGNLVVSVETAQQLMLVGGVHTIISMLRRYHDDTDILENGCRALGSFALYDETCLDVAQAGATETVLQAMKSPHNDVGVMDSCCWALACLTSIAHTCEELVSLDGVASVLQTLEDFPHEETLQDYGVRIICNIGALESTLPHVSTPRVVNVLTQIHDNFPDNVELLEYMLLALSQVASVEQTVHEYLLTDGGLKTVVTVMKSLEENPAIQENGCRIIGNMAVHECLRKAVEQQGASQVVLAAMLNIEMCADIHLYGCMALMNLTADLMDNKMRVKNNGAVPTLLATLRKFPDHPEVVLSALKTLGNLVDLQEACRQLLDDKGLATIVEICKDNKASDDIRSFTGLVLSGLTALPDLPIQDLLRVEETLVTLQAALPSDPDLALSMCHGLHNLMKSEIGLETLTKTGWMTVLENTTNQFQTYPEVHLTACRIVATVAMECREKSSPAKCPLSDSTMRTVLHSMRLFPDDKEVQIVASAALSCVCESFRNLRNAIVAEGGLTDVTTAMTNFPKDDRLHAVGLIALSYLLPVDVDTNREDASMVISVITRSMSNFVENEHIQISACRALERCEVEGTDNVFDILTCVHNGVRRHGGKKKVLKAAGRVFKRFGSDEGEEITEQMLTSPTTPLCDIFVKIMKG